MAQQQRLEQTVEHEAAVAMAVPNFSKQPQDLSLNMGGPSDSDTIKAKLAPHSVNTSLSSHNI
jgi:hypothetical protein